MYLGEQLRQIRMAQDVSVYKLSKDSDISENHIHSIEKGTSQPSVAVLEKLLNPLGMTLCEFFNTGETVVYPTENELQLLQAVRRLSGERAQLVLSLAQALAQ